MAEYCSDKFLLVEDNEDQFQFWQGLVGPHFTPIVENDGTLRWTNNGLLPNPDAVNLRGPQGAGLTIGGIRETEEELPAQAPPGAIWLVGEDSPYEGWSFISGAWVHLGSLSVGPAGPIGPQGNSYVLTAEDKAEIADEAETLLLNDLNNNPLPISRGGTGAQTLAGAKTNLGITEIEDQIGDTPLATNAQDIRGAINEIVGDLGNLDFDTEAQNVTGAVNELAGGKFDKYVNVNTGAPVTDLRNVKRNSAGRVYLGAGVSPTGAAGAVGFLNMSSSATTWQLLAQTNDDLLYTTGMTGSTVRAWKPLGIFALLTGTGTSSASGNTRIIPETGYIPIVAFDATGSVFRTMQISYFSGNWYIRTYNTNGALETNAEISYKVLCVKTGAWIP